ncbi:uncharacterized protein A1O9_08526 [Exophiala aquamarina CBS 119918]|uniref:Glycoside hydrolase family 127 protein n=1 Tax=Exophiala aquamarina CBS 119918 TaxID=1182545 RepID=A0A072PJX3_9EURO|nr:uncharacterized protein A1O9_08526 [Exophiala aquamarina CBS 119918]KEF55775.1 hypothetical protein A1O9_08526 [Exophiala aquamarina CBS 119918]
MHAKLFWESDIFKTVEAACYSLLKQKDDALLEDVENAVEMIRNAQHPDGYINSYFTVTGLSDRWTNLRDLHELYCLGHLVEACVAYETLTNSGKLLEPVTKAIGHVDSVFGAEPGKLRGYPGHQEIEIGLLRLFEMTRNPLFFNVAKYFLMERGRRDENNEIYFDLEAHRRGGDLNSNMFFEMKAWYRFPRDYAYHQADCTLVEADELKGHAVRAMYYMIAATDLYRLDGNERVKEAIDRLWRDMVDKKMYVTGGLGAIRQWEGFGPSYFLYDTEKQGTCYTETCATFAMILWCQRLLRLNLDSEYGDVMEIGLYNGFLGAIGLDGTTFYYENPLRTYTGEAKIRTPWLDCACCPPNVAKLLGLLGTIIYSYTSKYVAIHLYLESSFVVPNMDVVVSQTTGMPWSGQVNITVKGTTGLCLRIPGWAQHYTCSLEAREERGYLYIEPAPNIDLKLTFTMQARKVYTNPKTNKDEVCIMRGPLVYCIEDVDNDVDVDNILLLDEPLSDIEPQQIAGVDSVVQIRAVGKEILDDKPSLYRFEPWKHSSEKKCLTYVPFFLRANRGGKGGMRVWSKYVL